jgi:hypothetical protein
LPEAYMYKIRAKHLLIGTFSCALPVFAAATPAIGVAISQGNIMVDNLKAPGSATIFDGNVLQTSASPSQVRLKDGAKVRLAMESRGRLFSDHMDLQQGSASISGYSAKANGLSVRPDANASAVVTMQGKAIEVAAVTGNVHVFNAQGVNVANLIPGSALSLSPQESAATASSSLVGCAVKQGNELLLTDETSNITVKLSGDAVHTGKRVQLTGAILPDASQTAGSADLMKVSAVKEVGGPCKPAYSASARAVNTVAGVAGIAGSATVAGTAAAGVAAAGGTAATAAAGAATAGISASTAVVAGVAAAATVGTVTTVTALNPGSGGTGKTGSTPNCISPCTF